MSTLREYIPYACADCMEEAGGRQRVRSPAWHVDTCPCCGRRKALTEPRDFGYPELKAKQLPLTQEEPA